LLTIISEQNKNIFFNTVGTFLYSFFQWLITIVIIRISTAENAGVYSLAYSLTNMFSLVATSGMRNYQISDILHKHTDGTYIMARVFTCIASFILFAVVLFFTGFSKATLVCCVMMMLFKIFEAFTDVFFGIMQKINAYKSICISLIIKGTLPFVLFCALLYFANLFWAIAGMGTAYLLILLFFDLPIIRYNRNFTAKIQLNDIKKILIRSFPLISVSLSYLYLTFITRYGIEKRYSTTELGYFSSVTVALTALSMLIVAALAVMIPGISTWYAQKQFTPIKKILLKIICGTVLLITLLYFSSSWWGAPALRFLFGDVIFDYVYLLKPTLLASGFSIAIGVFAAILTAIQKRLETFIAAAAAAVFGTFVVAPFIMRFGMTGSLYCLIAAWALQCLVMLVLLLRRL